MIQDSTQKITSLSLSCLSLRSQCRSRSVSESNFPKRKTPAFGTFFFEQSASRRQNVNFRQRVSQSVQTLLPRLVSDFIQRGILKRGAKG